MILRLLYIAVFVVASVLVYKTWTMNSVISSMQEAPFGNSIGPDNAKLTIVEFLDYRCSFCRAVHPTLKEFLDKHNDVRIVFRHWPILGKGSEYDARLALAAGKQGKFIEVHEMLIKRDKAADDSYIMEIAIELDLDYDQLMEDFKGKEIGMFFWENDDAMKFLGSRATPTFLFNDVLFIPDKGLPSVEQLEKLKEEVL
jgi:protein-disulfide isomerase